MSDADACLDDGMLADLVEGSASPELLARVDLHAASCEACRELLAYAGRVRAAERRAEAREETLPNERPATLAPSNAGEGHEVPPGTTIGRYRIETVLGRGGMGVVYAARDETLHRRVALKLLRRALVGDEGQNRLLREARAMANVHHANVTTVLDTGVHAGQVFVVIDLVEGGDLRQWLRRQARTWREVVDVFCDAGQGLVAVHAMGLVHRDFKPGNVLVDDTGKALITDFGLVGCDAEVDLAPELSALELFSGDRTETGTLLGTPRYMSPEQVAGRAVDASSDQFSFCIALWEALTGRNPFGEGDLAERTTQMRSGIVEASARDASVPPVVLAVVRRGLAVAPEDRWPSMSALLRALRHAADRNVRRRRALWATLAVGAALSVGLALGGAVEARPCAAQGRLPGIWDEPTRAEIRAAAPTTSAAEWERFVDHVEGYTRRLADARREACEATHVRAEVSEDMLDRRMACLQRRQAGLTAMVDALRRPGPVRPLDLAYRLPELAPCEDLAALATVTALPASATDRAEVDRLQSEEVALATLRMTGRIEEARTRADAAIADARVVGWSPVLAALLSQRAMIEQLESPPSAVPIWREAFIEAARSGHLVAFETAQAGASVLTEAERYDEAAFAVGLAEAYAEQLGSEPRPGELATTRFYLAMRRGDIETAEAQARLAVEQLRGAGAEDEAGAAMNLGGVLAGASRVEEALPWVRRGVELSTEAFGPTHPQTLHARHNEAYSLFLLGRYEQANAAARAILDSLRGMDLARDEASAHSLMGQVATIRERWDEAVEHFRAAVALVRRTEAPHGTVERELELLSLALSGQGEHDEAIALLTEALDRLPDDPARAGLRVDLLARLSEASAMRGDAAAELSYAEQAYAIASEVGDDMGMGGLHAYAVALNHAGRSVEALPFIDRAIAVADTWGSTAPRMRGQFWVDRAEIRAAIGERESARADLKSAFAVFDGSDDREHDAYRRAQALARKLEGGDPSRGTDPL